MEKEHQNFDQQIHLDFNDQPKPANEHNNILTKFGSIDNYQSEKEKVAKQYKTFPEHIEWKNDNWYMKNSNETVEDWDKFQDMSDMPYQSGQR